MFRSKTLKWLCVVGVILMVVGFAQEMINIKQILQNPGPSLVGLFVSAGGGILAVLAPMIELFRRYPRQPQSQKSLPSQ